MKDENSYLDNFQMQISELEMLQSTYCNPGEFVVDDPGGLADITGYLEQGLLQKSGLKTFPGSKLQYTITSQVEERKFEVCCVIPHEYPWVHPDVHIRSEDLLRDCQRRLNEDSLTFLEATEKGELCVGLLVQWLRDNASSYAAKKTSLDAAQMPPREEKSEEGGHLRRYWIYSHHIYSKTKRRNILDFAKDLGITGFCLPGKPGIMCAEGDGINCSEFWHRVKRMTWKKIMCTKEEREDDTDVRREQFCHFSSFEEVSFISKSGHNGMDMGEFLKYLDLHNCRYAFKDYFGFEGKV